MGERQVEAHELLYTYIYIYIHIYIHTYAYIYVLYVVVDIIDSGLSFPPYDLLVPFLGWVKSHL